MGEGNKFSDENVGLWRAHFDATSHLKVEAKKTFLWTLMPHFHSCISYNSHKGFFKPLIVTQFFFSK